MDRCIENGCKQHSLSLSDRCWKHIQDKAGYRTRLSNHIRTHNSIKGFYLRHLEFKKAQWYGIDAEQADLAGVDLSESDLTAANMKGVNLTGANMQKANLASVDFEDAHMLKCSFRQASLWHAVIKNANIAESDFTDADLLKTIFSNVKFWHVKLEGAKFLTRLSFQGRIPIDETGALSASEAYRELKRYFVSYGRYDDASWASFKEKTLQRRDLLRSKRFSYIPSLLMSLLCGYGEKPYRVVVSSLFLILFYGILYSLLGVLVPLSETTAHGLDIWDYIYFSIITFTTVGFGDLNQPW